MIYLKEENILQIHIFKKYYLFIICNFFIVKLKFYFFTYNL